MREYIFPRTNRTTSVASQVNQYGRLRKEGKEIYYNCGASGRVRSWEDKAYGSRSSAASYRERW